MNYELPKLSYGFEALEPFIDAKTMEIHLTKHHQTYIDKLNAVLGKYPDIAGMPLEELLMNLENLPMEPVDKTSLRNNGGGHVNHGFFWSIMGPVKEPNQQLASEIIDTFGSIPLPALVPGGLGSYGTQTVC
jgi:superoxide dismutase, Fe-Mn family